MRDIIGDEEYDEDEETSRYASLVDRVYDEIREGGIKMKKIYAQSAWTKHPNTPETDMQLRVLHVVNLSDGKTVEVMAIDPMDAIDKVNKMLDMKFREVA
jgi:hypothetical protein